MTFTVPGDPIPLARARMGRGTFYDSQKHEKFVASMGLTHQMAGLKLFSGPLEMEVVFFMPMGAKGKHKTGRPHFSKPDLDNLIKFASDISNKIIFSDDCSISKIVALKVYDSKPRTVFTIKEMPDEPVIGQEAKKIQR
jgi:Holliday junction resolvase RusA-like endonuclease